MSAQMTRLLQILLILPRYPRSLTTDGIKVISEEDFTHSG